MAITQQPQRDGKPRCQVDTPPVDTQETRVRHSDNSERLSEYVTLYRNAGSYQVIVAVCGTSRPDKLEQLAADVMDAAATLRARQQGGES